MSFISSQIKDSSEYNYLADLAADEIEQLERENAELRAENKKLGETNEQLGNYYMKINSMYWNDEIFEVNHGEGFYTDEFVDLFVEF